MSAPPESSATLAAGTGRTSTIFPRPVMHEDPLMKLFDPAGHVRSHAHRKIYARAELAYTVVDFSAAVLFVAGSVLFFSASTTYAGTWLFLIGSILFGLRPTIKLVREIAYRRVERSDGTAATDHDGWAAEVDVGTVEGQPVSGYPVRSLGIGFRRDHEDPEP